MTFEKSLIGILLFNLLACGDQQMSDLFLSTIPNNVGATTIIPLSPTLGAAGQPMGLIDFNGDAQSPEVVTISCYAKAVDTVGGVPGGPIVGILSFGVGNGQAQNAEFDIPVTRPSQPDRGVWNGTGSGVLISFPMCKMTLGVRNDAGVIPPILPPAVNFAIGALASCQVSCAMATGGKNSNDKVYRNIYAVSAVANGLPVGASVFVAIPSFATRYRVLRTPVIGTPISVVATTFLTATGGLDGPFLVPGGTVMPFQDIPPGAQGISVFNDPTSVNPITNMVVQFELGL